MNGSSEPIATMQPEASAVPPTPPPPVTKLSVVIPVYNEASTVEQIVAMVVAAPLPPGVSREVICVNDCSTDGSREKLDAVPARHPGVPFTILHKPANEG